MRRRVKQEPARALSADPPWKFGDRLPGKGRGAEKHYGCLSLPEIMRYPLPEMLPDSVLFLWRVSSMVEEAYQVARAWGFTPKSEIVWVKRTREPTRFQGVLAGSTTSRVVVDPGPLSMGMGRVVRGAHETCIVATRGRFKPDDLGVRMVFDAPRGPHSQKPDEFYALVERLVRTGPRVELFARTIRAGWRQYGDQLEGAEAHP